MRQAWIYNYWHWCSFHERLVLHNLPGKQIPDAEVFFRKLTANIFKVLTFHLTKIKTTDAQRTPIIVNSNVKHLGYNNHGPWHFVQSCLAALRWKRCCQQLTRIRTTRSTTVSSGWETNVTCSHSVTHAPSPSDDLFRWCSVRSHFSWRIVLSSPTLRQNSLTLITTWIFTNKCIEL